MDTKQQKKPGQVGCCVFFYTRERMAENKKRIDAFVETPQVLKAREKLYLRFWASSNQNWSCLTHFSI